MAIQLAVVRVILISRPASRIGTIPPAMAGLVTAIPPSAGLVTAIPPPPTAQVIMIP
jgi:hypothetical protein